MRIAFAVLKYFPFGGLERDMLRMAESAAKRRIRILRGREYSLAEDAGSGIPGYLQDGVLHYGECSKKFCGEVDSRELRNSCNFGRDCWKMCNQ